MFVDNRGGYSSANEYDPIEAFVERLYEHVLNRSSDAEGMEYWTKSLKEGSKTGAQVAAGFVLSEEFVNQNVTNEAFIDILYRTCMNREGDAAGKQNWLECLQTGFSRTYVLRGFMESREFSEICDLFGIERGTITLTENRDKNEDITRFVSRCYQVFLERLPDEGGLNDWTGQVLANPYKGQNVPYGFVFSQEMNNKNHSNEMFVTLLYRGILNREPDSAGLADWVSQLESGKSKIAVYKGFVCSQEFQGLLAEYGLPFDQIQLSLELTEAQREAISENVQAGDENSYEGLEDLKEMINGSLSGSTGSWSVYVKNLHTGEYMAINNHATRAASVIKIFAMEAIYRQIAEGITVQDTTINTLLRSMITYSDNTSYNELLRRINNAGSYYSGAVALNEYLLDYGYTDTRSSGTLHPANTASAYLGGRTTTSVVDCGNLLSSIYYGTLVSEQASEEMENLLLQSQRRWKIPAGLPAGTKCGNKTGENDYAQNDAAIVYSPNCDYVICVFSENANQYTAISKIAEISSMVYNYFN